MNKLVIAFGASARRWNSWSEKSANRKIFSAMVTVGGLGGLVKVAATAKHLVIAQYFGTSDALDAFLIAFLVPSFAVNITAGALNAAFLPAYVRAREEKGKEASQELFSNVMLWSAAFLFLLTFFLAGIGGHLLPILGSGFSPQKQTLTLSLFYILLPILAISGLGTLWASILNAGERFALAAVAPVMTPLISVLALVSAAKFWGVYALAIGTLTGFSAEAGLLIWALKKRGFSLRPRWNGMSPLMRQVIRQYFPMAGGACFMAGTDLVDQSMAAMLAPGSVSALSYGNKLTALFLGVGAMALGTAVFPYFSRMVAINDWDGVRHTLRTYFRLIAAVTIPVSLLLIFFSAPLVHVVFQRGAFLGRDTQLVSTIQTFYALQIPFYVLGIMGVRLLSALEKNHVLMVISLGNLGTNIAGNYLFMRFFGVAGIALSTSIVYAFSMCLIFGALSRALKTRELGREKTAQGKGRAWGKI